MKQKFLSFVALAALLMGAQGAWADDVVEVLNATQDGWYRTDKSSITYNIGSGNHIELKHSTESSVDKDFYGILSFDIPEKDGYKVASVSLRLVSKMIKTTRTTGFYKLDADLSSSPNYATLTPKVTAALATSPLGTVSAEGNSGKQITDNDIAEKYQTLASWTNNIALDASKVNAGETLNLLFAIIGDRTTNSNTNRFFGKNAAGFTNSNYAALTATSEQIVPQLTVTYAENTDQRSVASQPTADLWVRSDNTGAKNGTGQNFEIKSDMTEGAEKYFYGLMSFNVSAPSADEEIVSATLRLTTRVERGDRATAIYAVDATLDEANTSYSTVSDAVTEALSSTALATFTMEGHSNKAITDNGLDTKYQTVSAWQHNIDLTSYVKGLDAASFTILIRKANNTGGSSSAFFTKEVTDQKWNAGLAEIGGTTIAKEDLVPQLTIVYKKKETYALNVTSAGMSTLVLPFNVPTLPAGVAAYKLTSTATAITATEETSIEANKPVLIVAEEGSYTFMSSTSTVAELPAGEQTYGALTGVYTATTAAEGTYVLQKHDGYDAAFYQVAAGGKTVQAYRAYLTAPASARELSISFGGSETTGIGNVNKNDSVNDKAVYDLQGRRMANSPLKKGLYIVNGKKCVVK